MGLNGETLIALTPNEFERLATGIRQQVADGLNELKGFVIEKPLTRKEAASHLRIAMTAFNNRLRSGAIPSKYVHKNGGTLYFYASELNAMVKETHIKLKLTRQ
jgi:hypothetical protein